MPETRSWLVMSRFASPVVLTTRPPPDRLARLEAEGFIEKHPHPDDQRRSIYTLTERGLGLIPVLVEMILWSAREDPDTGAEEAFVREAMHDREGLIQRLQRRA